MHVTEAECEVLRLSLAHQSGRGVPSSDTLERLKDLVGGCRDSEQWKAGTIDELVEAYAAGLPWQDHPPEDQGSSPMGIVSLVDAWLESSPHEPLTVISVSLRPERVSSAQGADSAESSDGASEDLVEDLVKDFVREATPAILAITSGAPRYISRDVPTQQIAADLVDLLSEERRGVQHRHFEADDLAELITFLETLDATNVLLVPPLPGSGPKTLSQNAIRELQPDFSAEGDPAWLAGALPEILPCIVARAMAPGTRILWFGFHAKGNGLHPDSLRSRARTGAAEACQSIKVLELAWDCAPAMGNVASVLGGHYMHSAVVGGGSCALFWDRTASWIDWFLRFRPAWFSTSRPSPEGSSNAVLIRSGEEAALPWREEFFREEALQFRQTFQLHGRWVPLGSLGWMSQITEWMLEEEDLIRDETAEDAEEVPLLPSPEEMRAGQEVSRYRLFVRDAEALVPDQVQSGDLAIRAFYDESDALWEGIEVLSDRHAGSVLLLEDWGGVWFRFRSETPQAVREWVAAFLTSPLGDRWVSLQGLKEIGAVLWPEQLLVPIPEPSLLRAFEATDEIQARLEGLSRKVKEAREALLDQPDITPDWHRLRRFHVQSRAVERLLDDGGFEDLALNKLFPLPISLVAQEFQEADVLKDRHDLGLRLGENLSAYVAVLVAILESGAAARLPNGPLEAFRSKAKEGLTFGSTLGWLEDQVLRDFQRFTLSSWITKPELSRLVEALQAVRGFRNEASHLRGPSGDTLAGVVEKLEENLNTALSLFEPLSAVELLAVSSAENDPVLGTCHRFQGRLLAGDHPRGLPFRETEGREHPVISGTLYLRQPDGELHVADPFVTLNPEGRRVEVGVMDTITESAVRYRSLQVPGSWSSERALRQVERLFS